MKATLGETLHGPAGTATEVLFTLDDDDPVDWAATVATWWLDCPDQTPFWRHYHLGIVHLRPLAAAAARPPVINIPGATHELILYAVNPEPDPQPDDPRTWQALHPLNLVEQLQLPDDAAACGLLRQAAQAVVAGLLWAEPPLSGQVEPWRSTLIKTSAHWRGEEHAP